MSVKNVKKVASDIQNTQSKETCKPVLAFTPLLILIIAICILVLVGYRKFLYVKSWSDLIFDQSASVGEMSKDNPYKRVDAPVMSSHVEVPSDSSSSEADNSKTEKHKINFPYYGDAYAKLTIDNKNVGVKDVPVFWGDGDDLLDQGLAQSNYSSYIGVPGRVVIAGHNHTYFINFKNIKVGDTATLTTDYGKFVYKVKKTEIRRYDDTTLLYYDPTEENVTDDLIMYTCWNNGYMGASDERLYAVCEVVSREYYD